MTTPEPPLTLDEVQSLVIELLRTHLNDDPDSRWFVLASAHPDATIAGLVAMFASVIRASTPDTDGFLDALLLEADQPARRRGSAFVPSRVR